ncbi:MAG: holo-[acyl-carrier-protein] synthase, partial [Bacteroidetes bacterium]|nr:holo-[acyl-carrier-protein] synthase [Bacteroidota bacterium]
NDIVENHRIGSVFEEHRDRFLKRVYTEEEANYCLSKGDPIPFLAARFACKEAFIKAVGLDPGEVIDFREVELKGSSFGKKRLAISGKAEKKFQEKGFKEMSVSISHSDSYSTAVVILYGE